MVRTTPDALRRVCVLALALTVAASSVNAQVPFIQGYASKQSVMQGEAIDFHVSTNAVAFDLHIYRQGASLVPMLTVGSLAGNQYTLPDSVYWYGCDWPAAYVLDVPVEWPSGVYLAEFDDATGASKWTVFVVREDQPGSVSPILFTTCETTWQAYNNWGGKSLYPGSSSGHEPSAKVSFDRPYNQWSGQGHFYRHGAAQFIIWAESEGYALEYAAGTDLHRDPGLLSNYTLYLSVGHDEYWSYEMRGQLESFRDAGQSLGFFSANSIYWQVRFENDVRRMTCFKDSTDPLLLSDPERVTVKWRDPPVNRPEAALIGVQYNGGRCGSGNPCNPAGQPAAVADPDHWIFQGTGLGPGDSLGTAILHWEWDQTVAGVTPEPVEIVLEAWPLAWNGNPSLYQSVYFQNGGKIFAGGTVGWGLGLAEAQWGYADADVQQATDNILKDLLVPLSATFAPEGASATPPAPTILVAPNPTRTVLNLELNVPRATGDVTFELYDVRGRLVDRFPFSHMTAGAHSLTLRLGANGEALASGTYFLRSNLPGSRATKVVVIR